MGSTCSFCEGEDPQQANPNNAPYKRVPSSRQKGYRSGGDLTTDSEYESNTEYTDIDEEMKTPQPVTPRTYSKKERKGVLEGFKHAIETGNDSLVMHYTEGFEYSTLELLNVFFENGDTCLHVAVRAQKYALIVYFLSQGVSANLQNQKNGDTALHTAVRIGNINSLKIATILQKYNVDINIENKKGKTALSVAQDTKSRHKDDIIELLAPETVTLFTNTISDSDKLDTNRLNNMPTSRLEEFTMDILSESDIKPKKKSGLLAEPDDFDTSNTMRLNEITNDILTNDPEKEKPLVVPKYNKTDVQKIKKHNPFSKLKRDATKRVLNSINDMDSKQQELPKLEGWLEKKQGSPPYSWQKRFVVVKESHLLWSDKKLKIGDVKMKKERDKWNTSINLMSIKEVRNDRKSKDGKRFVISVKQGSKGKKTRDYLLRVKDKKQRDFWVKGIKQHIESIKKMVSYLGKDDLDA